MARELAQEHSSNPQEKLDLSSGIDAKAAVEDNLSKKQDKKMFQARVEDPAHQLLDGRHRPPQAAQKVE